MECEKQTWSNFFSNNGNVKSLVFLVTGQHNKKRYSIEEWAVACLWPLL